MAIKITREVEEMLATDAGRMSLIALKLCDIAESLKCLNVTKDRPVNNVLSATRTSSKSMWEDIFGHKGNE